MVPQPHLNLKNLYTAHNAQRGDRWQIQKHAIMYQSLKRLHFSILPRVLAGLKGTYTYRTQHSEEHTCWVHAFTFIYTHLADALFCRGTHGESNSGWSSDFLFSFFFFDHLPEKVKVRDRASWKSETLDDSLRENVRENKREKSELIWEVSWIFSSFFLLFFLRRGRTGEGVRLVFVGWDSGSQTTAASRRFSEILRTFLFLAKGEVHKIWRLVIGRGKKKGIDRTRKPPSCGTLEKAGNTHRNILHHGG